MIQRLYRWYHDLIYQRQPAGRAGLAKKLLRYGTPVYRKLLNLDRWWRRRNRRSLPRPVISIGNIVVGGSGKTEFVSALTEQLQQQGLRVAILKRGQGEAPGPTRIRGGSIEQFARECGDEVAVLFDRHPGALIASGADRYEAGQMVLPDAPDLFLLDDGFQHIQLERQLDVVLVGELRELDNQLLPAGPLREPVNSLNRADRVSFPLGSDSDSWPELSGPSDFLQHGYRFDAITRGNREVTADYRREPIRPLLTLARPHRVLDQLRGANIRLEDPVLLPDHGSIPEEVLEAHDPEQLLVTDKEWVKLPSGYRRDVNRLRSEFVIEGLDQLSRDIVDLVDTA